MIVVAIIGILAAISLPMFANLVAKTQESTTKGNLGTLRSALAIYYGDMEGLYPVNTLTPILTAGGKYLSSIPVAYLPKTPNNVGHPASNMTETFIKGVGVFTSSLTAYLNHLEGSGLAGGWVYDATGPSSATYGMVCVTCTHQDLKGQEWESY